MIKHAGAEALHGLRAALAHVAVAGDHAHFAGEHHVRRALDAVRERLTATVQVVELALGHRVVDVDGRALELVLLEHLVQAMHARGGLFTEAADGVRAVEQLRVLLVQIDRQIAAVVQDHVRTFAAFEGEDLLGEAPIVLGLGLALPGEHRHAGLGDGGGSLILRRVDVARRPGDLGAEVRERLDQHRGLDGHVQAAGDARALERLLGAEFFAQCHQARHLGLGDRDLLAAPISEANIGNAIALAFLGGDSALLTALGRTGFLNALHDHRLLLCLSQNPGTYRE